MAKPCAVTDLPSLSSWLEDCRAAKSYDIRAMNLLGLGNCFSDMDKVVFGGRLLSGFFFVALIFEPVRRLMIQ